MPKANHKTRTSAEISRMIELYEDNHTLEEVGLLYDLSRERIRQILKQAGHPLRKYTRKNTPGSQNKYDISEAALRELYWKEEKNLRDIAAVFGCAESTIYQRFKLYGIPLRSRSAGIPPHKKVKYPEMTEDAMQRLFINEDKSTKEIAELLGCSRINVYKRLEKFGIKKPRQRAA